LAFDTLLGSWSNLDTLGLDFGSGACIWQRRCDLGFGVFEPKRFNEDYWSPRVFLGILNPQRLAQVVLSAF
jgi:hypothetical protein